MDVTLTGVLTVQVPPRGADSASNVTVSPDPGTDAPPAPPVVADQCVVSDASQVPLSPTQKREAMAHLPALNA